MRKFMLLLALVTLLLTGQLSSFACPDHDQEKVADIVVIGDGGKTTTLSPNMTPAFDPKSAMYFIEDNGKVTAYTPAAPSSSVGSNSAKLQSWYQIPIAFKEKILSLLSGVSTKDKASGSEFISSILF